MHQTIQIAFGGLATPPGMLIGALVNKQLHFPAFLHALLNASKSNISPSGMPSSAIQWSCSRQAGIFAGHASKTAISPPIATKCLFHNHLTVSSQPRTPDQCALFPAVFRCSIDRDSNQLMKPLRMRRMSPGWKSTPCQAATDSISFTVMSKGCVWSIAMPRCSHHAT